MTSSVNNSDSLAMRSRIVLMLVLHHGVTVRIWDNRHCWLDDKMLISHTATHDLGAAVTVM